MLVGCHARPALGRSGPMADFQARSGWLVPRIRHLAGRGSNPRQVIHDGDNDFRSAKNAEEGVGGCKLPIDT